MTPETIQVLGTVATLYGLGGAFSVLFQARQMRSRGSSGDVSARFFAVYVGGFAIWLLYGLGIGSVPIIVVHAVGLLCGATTLGVVIRLRGAAGVAATSRLTGEDRARVGAGSNPPGDSAKKVVMVGLETISKLPSGVAHPTPLLFVHGAWHGAWCWDRHFLDYFARHGFAAHALSLRGHGESEGRDRLRWTRPAEYVADVAQVAQRFPRPPVVIGHSMGGAVVQKYLETHAAPAGVLLASVPPSGVLVATARLARRHPVRFAQANLTLSLLP